MTRAVEFLVGHLRLPPREAWRTTIIEYDAAVRGYLQSKGIDPSKPRAMTRRRLEELRTLYPDT